MLRTQLGPVLGTTWVVGPGPKRPSEIRGDGAARLPARPLPRLVDFHPWCSGFFADHRPGRFSAAQRVEPQLNQMLRWGSKGLCWASRDKMGEGMKGLFLGISPRFRRFSRNLHVFWLRVNIYSDARMFWFFSQKLLHVQLLFSFLLVCRNY